MPTPTQAAENVQEWRKDPIREVFQIALRFVWYEDLLEMESKLIEAVCDGDYSTPDREAFAQDLEDIQAELAKRKA